MRTLFISREFLILNFSFLILLASCSVQNKISKTASRTLLKDSSLLNAHVGISIYDPATGKYLYNYQGDKYFVPASNTKLFTCYAAMKYLGDSLTGLIYNTAGIITGTGDPTLLHPDFPRQPVIDFFKKNNFNYIQLNRENWKEKALGFGWAWDDYNSEYMAERSPMPVYGNITSFSIDSYSENAPGSYSVKWNITPSLFKKPIDSAYGLPGRYNDTGLFKKFVFQREKEKNFFKLINSNSKFTTQQIPFVTDGYNTTLSILKNDHAITIINQEIVLGVVYGYRKIKSQPTDSVLRPMMHRSDNFFAEQMLLMVSNEKLGYMNDAAIIDTLLKTDLKDAPQKPKWVDGSGLSRYNLFTPQDFVYVLGKMKSEFGLERLKNIFPTGGKGTISSYYQGMARQIFAKTGTLSNNCALSGFLMTKSGKLLIFSILANNYQGAATPVRRAVERFLTHVRENY